MTGKTQLRRAVQKKFASKADKQILIPGLLGAYIGAVWMVSVPGRPSFVYVRVHGNNSEVIEAFNDTVSPILNLAVVLTRDELTPNYYRILRRDVAKYQDWYTPQIGYHATQHEFGGTGSMGADIVWIQKQQFTPLEVRPISTSGSSYQCFVDPEYYQWNAGYQFFSGSSTPDLNFLRPGGQLQGLFLGVYMDGNTDALAYITGTQFTHTPWPDNYRAMIPTIPTSVGIPLAGILLTHEMTGINWSQIYDTRPILGNGGMTGSPSGIPDAPSDGNLYGRENAAWVAVTGTGGGGIPDAPSDGSLYGRKNAGWTVVTGTGGGAEVDPLSLHLDQTAPQTFTNLGGGTGLLEVTAGVLGLDTKQYVTGAPWTGMGYITGSPGGDMLKSVYDPNNDGIIGIAQGGTNATGTAAARTNLGLGTAAIYGVGLTTGTVAPGNTKLDDWATPDDNTDLNVSLNAHGLAPKGTTGTTQYWRQDWTLATPAGGAGGVPALGMVNGQIVVTATGNNLVVALKTLAGTDPTASDKIQIQIGAVLHDITAALSVTAAKGTNWCNSGGNELKTLEADYFVYLGYNTIDGVVLGFSRIAHGKVYSDFSATSTVESYCRISIITHAAAGDNYVLVGRFAATLSGTAGFTWTVPTFTNSNLVQFPINESRWNSWAPTGSADAPMTYTITSVGNAKYRVSGNTCTLTYYIYGTTGGSAGPTLLMTVPFLSPCYAGFGGMTNDGTTISGYCFFDYSGSPVSVLTNRKYDKSNYGIGINKYIFGTITYPLVLG